MATYIYLNFPPPIRYIGFHAYVIMYILVYVYIYKPSVFYVEHSTTPCYPSRSKYVTMAHVPDFSQNPPAIDCVVDPPYLAGACVQTQKGNT